MLNINGNEVKVIKQDININDFTDNGIKGYDINIQIEFINNNKKGYIYLSAGFEKTNDISKFLNKEYIGIPFANSQINCLEICDSDIFLDTEIESEIILGLKDILNDKIDALLKINDKLINVEFKGNLNLNR